MLNNVSTNVERIVAKLDNDFNPDNSDWIPRVAAWVIDALQQINALSTERKKVKLNVCDGFAYSSCKLDSPNLIVTDCNGCEIDRYKSGSDCGCDSSTGKIHKVHDLTPSTVDIVHNNNPNPAPDYSMAMTKNGVNDTGRYDVHNYKFGHNVQKKSYTVVDDYKLELTGCDDYVYIETESVKTEYSKIFEADLPVVPNDGTIIDYVSWYCVYRMLTRGAKHPVFNLGASQYGTNPYFNYTNIKDDAKRAYIILCQGDINRNDGNLWRSSAYLTMFPRAK